MIRFKEFLAESHAAPLYHATTTASAIRILELNSLIGAEQVFGATQGKTGVFFTRSLKHAKHLQRDPSGSHSYAVFKINQGMLKHRYKVRPIKNHTNRVPENHTPLYMQKNGLGGNEFEEFTPTSRINDFINYVDKIYVKNPSVKFNDAVRNYAPHIKIEVVND